MKSSSIRLVGNPLEFGYTRLVEKEPEAAAVTHSFTFTRGLADAVDVYAGRRRTLRGIPRLTTTSHHRP